jgi:hypothetical protein
VTGYGFVRAAVGLSLCGTVALGCANIEMAHVDTTERVVQRDPDPVEGTANVASLTGEGTAPEVTVRKNCDAYGRERVEITNREAAKNRSAALDVALAVTGGVSAGLGVAAVLDAKNVYPNDPASRTYNSAGPGAEQAAGFALIGVGAVALAIAVIDVARAQRTEERVSFEARRSSDRIGNCEGQPVAGLEVEGRFEGGAAGHAVSLGQTGPDGKLAIDVRKLEPPSAACGLERSPFGESFSVLVERAPVGIVSLKAAYPAWIERRKAADLRDWNAADSSRERCRQEGDCAAIERYLGGALCYLRHPLEYACSIHAIHESGVREFRRAA